MKNNFLNTNLLKSLYKDIYFIDIKYIKLYFKKFIHKQKQIQYKQTTIVWKLDFKHIINLKQTKQYTNSIRAEIY